MKSLNKLWIFGDSFSKGLGLVDDGHQFDHYKGKEKFIWSTLLADVYGFEEMNQALNGISNDMIFDIIKSVYSSIKPNDKVVMCVLHESIHELEEFLSDDTELI